MHRPLLLALILAAPAPAVELDLSLIGPAEDRNIEKPFVARFRKNGLALTYIAAKHTYSEMEPTIALVRAVIAKEKPRLVLIEGYPAQSEPAKFLEYARRTCKESMCEGGEPAFAALAAAEKGIPFRGAEPSDAQVLEALEAQGFSETDLNGFYFTRRLPQLRAQGKLLKGSERRRFDEYMASFGAEDFSFDDYVVWYEERNRKKFIAELVDREEVAPRPDGRLFTQRIAAVVSQARDRSIARQTGEALAQHRRVLLILGASHFFRHEDALTAALGAPSISSWRGEAPEGEAQ